MIIDWGVSNMNQQEALNIIIKDLEKWVGDADRTDSMTYALDNGYLLHAANLWLGTGATSETDEMNRAINVLKIDDKKEMAEINALCESADIYICQGCNHHHFIVKDDEPIRECVSCLEQNIKKEQK